MAQALLLQSLRRFLDQPEGECWVWTHARAGVGYGSVWHNGKSAPAHRVFYELYREPVADGLEIDHLCKRPACCNPAHLEVVTRRENVRRSDNFTAAHMRTTHCPQGHPYDDENTRLYRGRRYCRRCQRQRDGARRRS